MATVVFALGQFDVTADVPTGLVVVHVNVTLQLLAPAAIVHVGAAGVRVPVAATDDEAETAKDATAKATSRGSPFLTPWERRGPTPDPWPTISPGCWCESRTIQVTRRQASSSVGDGLPRPRGSTGPSLVMRSGSVYRRWPRRKKIPQGWSGTRSRSVQSRHTPERYSGPIQPKWHREGRRGLMRLTAPSLSPSANEPRSSISLRIRGAAHATAAYRASRRLVLASNALAATSTLNVVVRTSLRSQKRSCADALTISSPAKLLGVLAHGGPKDVNGSNSPRRRRSWDAASSLSLPHNHQGGHDSRKCNCLNGP